MKAKDKHKAAMIRYWSNPENAFVNRITMHTDVLKLSGMTFYRHFSPDEITEIEYEAEAIRRKRYSKERSEVVHAMYIEGKTGNVSAAKEFLDRTEGRVTEKVEVDQTNRYPDSIKLKLVEAKEVDGRRNT